jgi:hypothetical protein
VLDAKPKLKDRRQHSIFKRPTGKWPLYVLYVAAAGLLVAGGVAIRSSRIQTEDPRLELIHAGQAIIRSTLKEGLHAAFADPVETTVEPMPGGKHMISGWVDLFTDAGRQDRQNYSVVVSKDNNGWTGEQISVLPQM